ncbi:hypothetical protein HU147_12465 [Planomicrobium chinense]|uniref:hypothetical protein n=1 Tax=Planococcus chinensis TaxID=272917 RepID=UPI001CC73A54|nr:hypothetical protein [Planococcus chinensis]MBZ5202033.1 hypothetical protein [Planococcus chinensis]
MFTNIKKRTLKTLSKFLTEFVIEALLMLLIFSLVLLLLRQNGKTLTESIDVSVFFAVVLAFLLTMGKSSVSKWIRKSIEDGKKLSDDYNALVKQYPGQKMIEYDNEKAIPSYVHIGITHRIKKKNLAFPVVLEKKLFNSKLTVTDNWNKQYELPEFIKQHYEAIMKAHEFSDVYNQLNIRLDDYTYEQETNTLQLITSRTTYYDSLVTNRAMDFKWGLKSTNREIFEYGPFVSKLSESSLSNHLGFNGFVETSDGKIIFVIRSKNVSIGKGTLGNSVAASLKTMYALNKDERKFTECGLIQSIIKEIQAELKIDPSYFSFSERNIIAIYRDLVEGGKPQLLFYVKVNQTSIEIYNNFKKANRKTNRKVLQSKLLSDGNKLIFVDKDKLEKLFITPGMVLHEKKAYATMPSASACIVLLIEYLKSTREMPS